MTEWPRIQTEVDDDRPAREEELEYCQNCGEPVLGGELQQHAGERRCEGCLFYCPVCEDAQVGEEGEFCATCAYWAMGVEV